MQNVLITGASGLIGTALIERLSKKSCSLFCQSRKFNKNTSRVRWVQHDLITDSWSKKKLPSIDHVFYLAAQTSVYEARKEPIADLESNTLGLLKLLEYLRKQKNCPVVIMAGTATQVGLNKKNPVNEKTKDNPCTFYDISKLCAEIYLKQYIKEKWIRGCVLRFGNVYGRLNNSQHKDRGVLDKIYLRALAGKIIKIVVNQKCRRDFIFINDIISALLASSENIKKTNGKTFYIGTGKALSLEKAFRYVISLAAKKTGKKVILKKIKPKHYLAEIEKRDVVIDSSRFRKTTLWRPQHEFLETLKQIYG